MTKGDSYNMARALSLVLFLLLAMSGAGVALADTAVEAPKYPFTNRYKATVFGTPPDFRYKLPENARGAVPEVRSVKIDGRRIPKVFWYTEAVEYSVMLQEKEAPLIFIIAGTGGRYNSPKVQFLQYLFYGAGYHTVALSSPTHFNFIVSMSKHGLSGYVPYDVDDLYTLMRWVKADVEATTKVSRYSVTGYSLGGLHSAFIAKRDMQDKVFNFEKVLVINPPVDLYNSALAFDSWLAETSTNKTTPQQSVGMFIERFSEFYKTNHVGRLDSEVLYQFFKTLDVTDEELKQIIGVGFRITSSSMIFTSDICLNAGYIVAPGTTVSTSDPLLPYFSVASRISFEQYFEELLLPYLQSKDSSITKEKALRACTLQGIESFLRTSENVYLIGNADDPILNEAEVAFLRDVFGKRGVFFPNGGHCGNLQYDGFAKTILEILKGGKS